MSPAESLMWVKFDLVLFSVPIAFPVHFGFALKTNNYNLLFDVGSESQGIVNG